MKASEYLLGIGFDTAHLPELFNDDDKSYYKIDELMEIFAQHVLSSEYGFRRVMQRIHYQLLLDFTNEAKNHIGKKFNEVPELMKINSAIEAVEKYLPKDDKEK